MTYFKNIKNLEELRKEYRRLVKENHPDNGGNEDVIKEINVEYEKLFDQLKSGATDKDKTYKYDMDTDEAIREMINKIINLNVTIEIVGSWIWVTGNTYKVKDVLKSYGFKWCSNKKAWAWHFGEWKKTGHKTTMEHIKAKYGYTTVKEEKEENKKRLDQ